MDSSDLIRYIEQNGIKAEMVHLETPTPTVEAAAAAVNVAPEQIGKSLLFVAGDQPVLVISNGTARVSYGALADYLDVSRRRLRLANAAEVSHWTGYPVGTVPPFGHVQTLRTLIDSAVMVVETIYVGGGAIDALMRIDIDELVRASNAERVLL
jgi:prolyl-tRNA editing enzyme YbaK/EbsC (Cys-tRNA(Pro) deacylase)